MTLLHNRKGNIKEALYDYGEELSGILFNEETYSIYKNRYLFWNESLDKRWNTEYQSQIQVFTESESKDSFNREKMHYLKGVVHMLIKRNFSENWTKEEFREKFNMHVKWMMRGLNDDGNN